MVQFGPQPFDAMLSEICAAFGCTPDVAIRQDPERVWAIMEYRSARAAVDLFNQGNKGYERLSKEPALQAILLEMHRAQLGDAVKLQDVYDAMASIEDTESP